MKKLLIVIDMQKDFITGPLASACDENFLPTVEEILNQALQENTELVFTMDTHQDNYLHTQEGQKLPIIHCVENSEGWEIIPQLQSYTIGKKIFTKDGFGCQELISFCQDYDEIQLMGVCTDICVITNALMLKGVYPHKIIKVIQEGCAGSTRANHELALQVLKNCQIELV